MAAISFEHVDVVFGRDVRPALAMLDRGEGRDAIMQETGSARRRARCVHLRRGRRALRPHGPVGLGQVVPAALRQRPQSSHARPRRRQRRRGPGRYGELRRKHAEAAAHEPHLDGLPAIRADAVAHDPGECRFRSRGAGHAESPGGAHHRRKAEARSPGPVGGQASARAFGRHAAARRPRQGLRHRRRYPAHGRAVLGPRPADPRASPGRAPGVAALASEDHRLRQPRSRRGAEDRQPHRHHGGGSRSSSTARRSRS